MKTFLAILFCATVAFQASAAGPSPIPSGTPLQLNRTAVAVAPLGEEEANTLLWMREEEKLARDVYRDFYRTWKAPVFSRIANSERSHMDALLRKLQSFGLPDPARSDPGAFSEPDLQALYDRSVAEGSSSYIDALRVGAAIEDLDIRDLQAAIARTGNLTLKTVYENLLEGSKNHLRAFVGLLRTLGVDYVPQYMDAELFEAVMDF